MFSKNKKQELLPVQVPWMISPSTSYLRLSASESASDEPTYVRFVANFGLENKNAPKKSVTIPEVFYPPYNSNVKLGPPHGIDQLVCVVFEHSNTACMHGNYSDREAVDPNLYDFSKLAHGKFLPGYNMEEWLAEFQSVWVKTGHCPNPRMYEVLNSFLINERKLETHGYKHYLLVGHDAHIEVIAKGWKWNSEGSLR